ncbi:hypothetical protein [Lichenifustis flavocetrariae]|uniref:Uncharacterized protein n=1 Tax=Lichenifustis flavocetrariae TaxID=2949735 RepID=A0AA41Z2J3_9HYPH|nr:hypothetical protein [Lichenifustis flavocetrariae]MCW6513041.1 hypothetical protein [Lichenifustis flavocetrariae]
MALCENDRLSKELAPDVFRRAFAEPGESAGLEVTDLIKTGIYAVQIW